MARYLAPETAPRDGTIIRGLFRRNGAKRGRVFTAAFDCDSLPEEGPPPAAPAWVHEGARDDRRRLAEDPAIFFRPIGDSEAAIEAGRMVGWLPLRSNSR